MNAILRGALVAASLALAACSGDDTTAVKDSGTADTSAQKDTGTTDTGTADTSTNDSAVDSGPQPVNECAQFIDKSGTGDDRTITFPTGVSAAQYTPNCLKVKAGQKVTWNGAFDNHPLMPLNGDSGNPITLTNTGTTKEFTFGAAGTYGFGCQFHSFAMFGAIQVVP